MALNRDYLGIWAPLPVLMVVHWYSRTCFEEQPHGLEVQKPTILGTRSVQEIPGLSCIHKTIFKSRRLGSHGRLVQKGVLSFRVFHFSVFLVPWRLPGSIGPLDSQGIGPSLPDLSIYSSQSFRVPPFWVARLCGASAATVAAVGDRRFASAHELLRCCEKFVL